MFFCEKNGFVCEKNDRIMNQWRSKLIRKDAVNSNWYLLVYWNTDARIMALAAGMSECGRCISDETTASPRRACR